MAEEEGIAGSIRHTSTRRCGTVTIDVCPACGYPTIGPDLCAFCRPLDAEWMPGRNSTTAGMHVRLVHNALPAFAIRPAHGCADQTLRQQG
jgi:hypothetical protein